MSKNVEELYEQKKFEIKDRDCREMTIAELEEQLNLVRNLNDHLDNELDKRMEQLDRIRGAIRSLVTGKIKKGIFIDDVMRIMRWRR